MERMYVPFEQSILRVTSGHSHFRISIFFIVTLRGSSLTSLPLRAKSYARWPFTLIAEKIGGV